MRVRRAPAGPTREHRPQNPPASRRAIACTAHMASATPTAPAASDRSSASVSRWRASRHRRTPSAPRSASSPPASRQPREREVGGAHARRDEHEQRRDSGDSLDDHDVVGVVAHHRPHGQHPARIGLWRLARQLRGRPCPPRRAPRRPLRRARAAQRAAGSESRSRLPPWRPASTAHRRRRPLETRCPSPARPPPCTGGLRA